MAHSGPDQWARFHRFRKIVELATRTLKTPRPDPLETGIASMESVVEAIGLWEVIGPIEAHVVNFSTKHPHPYKFFSPPVDKERMEESQESQLHGELSKDSGGSSRNPLLPRYQFDLLLSDAFYNGCSTPIWCEITEAAALLLNVEATELWDRTEEDQFAHVRDLILRMPKCELYIRLKGQKATVTDIQQIYLPVLINDKSGHKYDLVPASVWVSRIFHPALVRKRPWDDSKGPIDKGKEKEIVGVNDLKTHHGSASESERGSEPGGKNTESVASNEEPELSGWWRRSPVRNEEPLNDEEPHPGVPVEDEEPDDGLVRNNLTPPFGAANVAPILEADRRRHDPRDEAGAKLSTRIKEKLQWLLPRCGR